MSLSLSSIRYLAWVHKHYFLDGPVLLLGRQMIFGRDIDVAWAIKEQDIEPLKVDLYQSTPNIPGLDVGKYGQYTNDVYTFKMLLGDVEVDALDISDYQGANLIVDLEKKLPRKLLNRYGLIIDAGTLEHILDVKTAVSNLINCLKPGGHIIHMSPSCGYLDHGFYQFSPSFFYKFYSDFGLNIIDMTIVEQPIRRTNHKQWNFFKWDPSLYRKKFISNELMSVFCVVSNGKVGRGQHRFLLCFEEYLTQSQNKENIETRPWGLNPICQLSPRDNYPIIDVEG